MADVDLYGWALSIDFCADPNLGMQVKKTNEFNAEIKTFSFKIVYCFHYYTTKCVIKIKTDIKIKIQIKIGDVKHISRIIAAELKITTNTERMLQQTSR